VPRRLLTLLWHREPLAVAPSLGLLAVRFAAGAAFMLHGWGKIQHPTSWMGAASAMPGALQLLAAVSEFGGGAAWVLGLFVPLASLGELCTMAVAVASHVKEGAPFVGSGHSYELALVYGAIAVLLALAGPGRFATDAWLRRGGRAP